MTKFIKNMSFTEEVHQKWADTRQKKIKGFVMKLADTLDGVSVDFTIELEDDWKNVIERMPENDCRYFVYDLKMTKSNDFNGESNFVHILFLVRKPVSSHFVSADPV